MRGMSLKDLLVGYLSLVSGSLLSLSLSLSDDVNSRRSEGRVSVSIRRPSISIRSIPIRVSGKSRGQKNLTLVTGLQESRVQEEF